MHDWFYRQKPFFEKNLLPLSGEPLNCLEIGSFEGESTCWLLNNILTNENSRLTSIDPWEGRLDYTNQHKDLSEAKKLFDENTKDYKNLAVIQGYSQIELRKLVPESYDFIYIDGSHDANDCLEDMVLSWRLLKRGGMMAVDDYEWKHFSDELKVPKIAIDAFLRIWKPYVEVIDLAWLAWLRKR